VYWLYKDVDQSIILGVHTKMKQKSKLQFASLMVLTGISIFFITMHVRNEPKPPDIVSTPINTGLPHQANNNLDKPANNSDLPAVNQSSSSIDKNDRLAHVAPRQEQLSKTVEEEIEYRILANVNDPLAQNQWSLPEVNAPELWDEIDPSKQSVVAVIDSGFGLAHEDLVNQWHRNSGEEGMTQVGDTCWDGNTRNKTTNNCDDDSNGYVDDWRGWDFYYVDNIPSAGSQNQNGDGVSHGTQVSGLVGAQTNNSLGVASIGYSNKIMPLQVLNDDGSGYTSDIVSAVYYAVDNGADVINLSLGTAYQDNSLKSALEYAFNNNVIVIAAAGNCGQMVNDGICNNMPAGAITYPARYNTVFAVGAINQSRQRASFSSYGKELDIVAPGSGTLASTNWISSNQTSAYSTTLHGTSFASPIVASMAGVLRAENSQLSVDAAKIALVANSQKLVDMNGQIYNEHLGHGSLDSHQALIVARSLVSGSAVPSLLMPGKHAVSVSYSLVLDTTVAAGCTANNLSWCTVWLTNAAGDDRYLPYRQIQSGNQLWSWSTAVFGQNTATWSARAVSGNNQSADTFLIHKN